MKLYTLTLTVAVKQPTVSTDTEWLKGLIHESLNGCLISAHVQDIKEAGAPEPTYSASEQHTCGYQCPAEGWEDVVCKLPKGHAGHHEYVG